MHVYSSSFSTPHGNLKKTENDPIEFNIKNIDVGRLEKYSYITRYYKEYLYALKLINVIKKYRPSHFISSNMPIFHQRIVESYCIKNDVKFVFWLQDVYSVAIGSIFKKKNKYLGYLIGKYFESLEKWCLNKSFANILITEDFLNILMEWKIKNENNFIIHNWAPINEISIFPKDNSWSKKNGFSDKFVFMYSGTLGLKHKPELIISLAKKFNKNRNVKIVVIT